MPHNLDVPKFRVPLSLCGKCGGTHLNALEQDHADEITQCVAAIVRTPRGSRIEEPELGIDDPTFSTDEEDVVVHDAIERWEPRAEHSCEPGKVDEDLERVIRVNLEHRDEGSEKEAWPSS